MFAGSTGFKFCDPGVCEMVKAEDREKTWFSYSRGGIVDSRRGLSSEFKRASVQAHFLVLRLLWEMRSRCHYLKSIRPKRDFFLHIP